MKRITVLVLLSMLAACRQPDHAPPAISFYYWKTTFRLPAAERAALQQHRVSTLYVRYCDVALRQGQPVPVSPIVFQEALPRSVAIVPVVYIKNEVMLHPNLDVADIAQKLLHYIDQINADAGIQTGELQIDCDWTLTSRDTYFRFLDQLKRQSAKRLSATIRLHQVKYYATTGLPPVDRGVLMYYNMGRIGPAAARSIYDRPTAQAYLGSIHAYPRPLDVALPLFTWAIHLRDDKVIGLLNKTDRDTFANDPHFEQKTPPFFEVKENVLKLGKYFKQGDRVKVEAITADDLREMADDLSGELAQPPAQILFYDLDASNLNHYNHEKDLLEDVSRSF
ncbi:hypothetical protein [Dawidia soli]|uniref:Lipoprotein n=1 Tax=Dawidia soli TaxID=2782352 RepID=A0AAP2DA85_9BACT|nr:hypothetical protein [Dawidia soli]MBT1688029.1 hypothetical protein [Dawidia soli]